MTSPTPPRQRQAIIRHRLPTGDIRVAGAILDSGPQLIIPEQIAWRMVHNLNLKPIPGRYDVWLVPDLSITPPAGARVPLPSEVLASTTTDRPGVHRLPWASDREITGVRLWRLLGQAYSPFVPDWPEKIFYNRITGWQVAG